MRYLRHLLPASLLALALATPTAGAQRSGLKPAPAKPVAVVNDSGYSAREADFVVGKRVHLRSTHTFIGTILEVDDDHAFPAERFPRGKMKAVLMKRRDGPLGWMPMEWMTRIYVVR